MGGREPVSSAVPADLAERISDGFHTQAQLNREALERADAAEAEVRRQASAGDMRWITALEDDAPQDILGRLFLARNNPQVQAQVWAEAIDIAAHHAWQAAHLGG